MNEGFDLLHEMMVEMRNMVEEGLGRLEKRLDLLARQQPRKDWYSVKEVAEIVGRAPYTIQEHCRLGRINAEKRQTGRGNSKEWIISHAELERFRNYGPLPDPALKP
jgi:hypothetical protein